MSGHEKIVGVIGGMGPEATVDFMRRVIKATGAKDDTGHIRLIVDNNPKVPSRIEAIIHERGESPGPCLAEMAKKLEVWGADILVMPCNTAHYYHAEIQAAVKTPLLDMISLTVERIISENETIRGVGILASTAVLKIGLYKKRFAEKGVDLIAPADPLQERVFQAIRKIKAGDCGAGVIKTIEEAAFSLAARGAGAVLIACTELSIVGESISPGVRVSDSSQILAEATVNLAQGRPRSMP